MQNSENTSFIIFLVGEITDDDIKVITYYQ